MSVNYYNLRIIQISKEINRIRLKIKMIIFIGLFFIVTIIIKLIGN